jgi:hypothetical protein
LFDGIEAIDDRHVIDDFFVAELDKVSDAITDRPPLARFVPVSLPITEGRSSTSMVVATKRRRDHKVGLSRPNNFMTRYLPTRAERQNVDGSADGPHHVVVKKVCEGRHVAD